MKTVIINPNVSFAKGINKATIEPPLGIAYLASFLEENGQRCSLIDANILNLSNKEILSKIENSTRVIGISFNIVSAISACSLVQYLKSFFPNVFYIAGGPYPSSLPEICIEKFGFDAVCIGEGEITLLEIIKNISDGESPPFYGVKGIYYKENSKIIKNPPRQLIEDLDTIPFPKFESLPDFSLYKSRARAKPVGAIITSRGCPFQCVYCNKNIFHAVYRTRSVENIIAEIRHQINRFGIKQIDFLDDNLTFDLNYAHQLFDEIIANRFNLAINLQNGIRADCIDESLVKKMKEGGVFKVSMGVESGDNSVQQAIKKNLNLNKVLRSTELFKKYRIKVYGNFMFGLPHDNELSMQRTLDFALKMDPDIANFMITIPLPGTELFEYVKKQGKFLKNAENGLNSGFYGGKVHYILNGMDEKEILVFYKKSYRIFYFRLKKILDLLLRSNSLYEFRWMFDAAKEIVSTMLK